MARRRAHRTTVRGTPKTELRIGTFSVLIALVLAVVTVRLYVLQVVRHKELAELADRNRIRIHRMPAPRGLVFDSMHRALVDARPSFDTVVVPEDMSKPNETIARLEGYLGVNDIADRLAQAQDDGRPPYDPVTVEEHLDWQQVVTLETHQLDLPGVSLQVTPDRHYIYGPVAAHLLGYVGEATETDLRHLAGYHMGDEIGKFGLERVFENDLRGEAGGQEVEVDSVGRRLRMLRDFPDHPGDSLILTVNLDVQQAAEQAIGNRAGALVAIDPNTGYILAMVSHPSFDPNVFATGVTPAAWHALTSDPTHPLENRVIQGTYAPGSTFKLVDTIAGMEERTLTPDTSYYCAGGIYYGGREYRCWRKQGHGHIALHRAIVESCDVFFYNAGERLGIDRLAGWAHQLGLGFKSGIDLDNERAGVMPSSMWKEKRFGERWYPAETLSVAIGQGYVAVTPMQMAQVVAQIANGGTRYKPQFVREVEGADGTPAETYPPVILNQVAIDPTVLQVVRDAMCDVVNAPDGTGRTARLDNITVCGKTGTAQVVKERQGARTSEKAEPANERDNGWFVAYAPSDNPKIVIACVIEHAGHGGSAAGPVVHDVMQKFFSIYPPSGMPRQQPAPTPRSTPPGSLAIR